VITDFYSKLTEQEKKIFYVAMAIVLLMVVDRLFLGPSLSKMKAYDIEIEQQKKSIQQDLRFLTYKSRISEDDKALSPYYRNEYKTEEQVIAAFLKKLEMIATEFKINLIKVTPAETKERKGYKEYYANLECEGLLENVASFMHAVDTSQDLLKIVKINFTLKRASGDEVVVAMVVSKMFIGGVLGQEKGQQKGLSSGQETAEKGLAPASAGKNQKQTAEDSTSSSDAGGSSANSQEKPEEQTLENLPPQQSQGQDENVSFRYQMKGFRPSEKDLNSLEKEPPADPIKPSIFEKIVTKIEKKPGENAQENLADTEEQK